MSEGLELSILDAHAPGYAIALGRREQDIAIAKISFGSQMDALSSFGTRLNTALKGLGTANRPTSHELLQFGKDLFAFAIRDDLLTLYNRLPQGHVSLKILTNHSDLRQIPWEYLQEPNRLAPCTGRCVVRIIPTIGVASPPPVSRQSLTRILLVAAEPVGLRGVSWQDIKATIERIYGARLDRKFELKTIEGSDRTTLLDELSTSQFDIVHFSCHGKVIRGVGHLVLINRQTRGPDYVPAMQLGQVLAGRGIRLLILSACETSVPGAEDDFSSIAETLVRQGIPAVVANQAPVPNQSMAIFVSAIYRELLQSGNIDKAVTQGRIALSLETQGGPEWGITTLHRLDDAAQLYT